jgi:hypothetical protein
MNYKYAGMTVNERLYSENLDEQFYEAVKEKNVIKVIFILMRVDLKEESIIDILKNHGLYLESYQIK